MDVKTLKNFEDLQRQVDEQLASLKLGDVNGGLTSDRGQGQGRRTKHDGGLRRHDAGTSTHGKSRVQCGGVRHRGRDDESDGSGVQQTDSETGMSSYDENSSNTTYSDSDSCYSCNKKSKKKSKHKHKKSRSGRYRKTGDKVKRVEVWPHAKLSLQYAGKNLKYEQLDMPLFVAGFIETLSSDLKHKRLVEQLSIMIWTYVTF